MTDTVGAIVRAAVAEAVMLSPEVIAFEATLGELGLDSLDQCEVECRLEDELNRDLDGLSDRWTDATTVGDIANQLAQLTGG